MATHNTLAVEDGRDAIGKLCDILELGGSSDSALTTATRWPAR